MSNGNGNGEADDQWDEDDVRGILLNPVYTMGAAPTISDADWIDAQLKLFDELGPDEYFALLLGVIQGTFGDVVE